MKTKQENKTYAYIRVSTDKQEYTRQEHALKQKGYTDAILYTETFTGTKKNRPVFDEMKANLEAGDTVVFESLSRIGRNTLNVLETIKELVEEIKVNVVILKENFNFNANGHMDAMTNLMLNMFSAFAQFERDMTSDRTREALAAKKEAGIKLGRPQNNEHDEEIKALLNQGTSYRKVASSVGVTLSTVQRVARELKQA